MRLGLIGIWLAVVAALGCGGDGRARFTPSETTARQALAFALEAWRNDQPLGPVTGTSPLVQMVDSHRLPGQRLERYDILGNAPGDGPRVFAVRLTLDKPREEKRVRFVVLGIDPLWVLRYEDYEMLAHWEHPMDDAGRSQPGKK